jgi:hypothetical protein
MVEKDITGLLLTDGTGGFLPGVPLGWPLKGQPAAGRAEAA